MSKQKCLWDESHTYEVGENDTFRPLCPTCYHNIYKGIYQKFIPLSEFISDIEHIKVAHKYALMIDAYYKNIIIKITISSIND